MLYLLYDIFMTTALISDSISHLNLTLKWQYQAESIMPSRGCQPCISKVADARDGLQRYNIHKDIAKGWTDFRQSVPKAKAYVEHLEDISLNHNWCYVYYRNTVCSLTYVNTNLKITGSCIGGDEEICNGLNR